MPILSHKNPFDILFLYGLSFSLPIGWPNLQLTFENTI